MELQGTVPHSGRNSNKKSRFQSCRNRFGQKINPFEPKNEKVTMDALYKFQADFDEWQEAESKTFNPEQTLIFEIL